MADYAYSPPVKAYYSHPPPHPSYVHVYMYEQCKVVSVAQ